MKVLSVSNPTKTTPKQGGNGGVDPPKPVFSTKSCLEAVHALGMVSQMSSVIKRHLYNVFQGFCPGGVISPLRFATFGSAPRKVGCFEAQIVISAIFSPDLAWYSATKVVNDTARAEN